MVESGVKLLTCEYSRTIKTYLVVHGKSSHLVLYYMTTSLVVLSLWLPRGVHSPRETLLVRPWSKATTLFDTKCTDYLFGHSILSILYRQHAICWVGWPLILPGG